MHLSHPLQRDISIRFHCMKLQQRFPCGDWDQNLRNAVSLMELSFFFFGFCVKSHFQNLLERTVFLHAKSRLLHAHALGSETVFLKLKCQIHSVFKMQSASHDSSGCSHQSYFWLICMLPVHLSLAAWIAGDGRIMENPLAAPRSLSKWIEHGFYRDTPF